MTDNPTPPRTATDDELTDWLRDLLAEHAPAIAGPERDSDIIELRPLTGPSSQRRSIALAASAVVAVAAAVIGLLYVGSVDRQPVQTYLDTPPSATPRPADDPALLPPGIGLAGSSTSTPQSAATAAQFDTALDRLGWDVDRREDATRTVEGVTIEWAYYTDGDRRLLFALGPAELLDTFPELRDQLISVTDGYDWPPQTGATTLAINSDDHTLIVRSESIQPSGPTRSLDELRHLAGDILQALPNAPET